MNYSNKDLGNLPSTVYGCNARNFGFFPDTRGKKLISDFLLYTLTSDHSTPQYFFQDYYNTEKFLLLNFPMIGKFL